MKRLVAVIAAGLVLLSACGKEGEPRELSAVGDRTPSATATSTPKTSGDADATATPAATAAGRPTATQGASSPSGGGTPGAPAATAEPGKSKPPKDGRYVYELSGKATDPTNPAAGEQSYSGEQYTEVSHSGAVYTYESTNSESPGRTTIRTRWTDARVELLEISTETPIGTYGCKFNPVLVVTKFPIKPETYPTQTFKGEGNACDGKLDITVEAQETVKDAGGTAYRTWRAKVRTEIHSDNFDIVQNETRWTSPDLGIEVRSNGTQNGEVSSGAFQSKFSGSSTSVLKSKP